MLSELHVRGYQRLRMAPGMSPSGMHWRCTITPVQNVLRSNGARIASWDTLTAHYTSADERRYFGWTDAAHASPSRLAEMFIERLPAVAAAGYGEDWLYAGWYQHMVHWTYPDAFPIAYADWYDEPAGGRLSTIGGEPAGRLISAPPPGEADDE
jgi:hypothetical protein